MSILRRLAGFENIESSHINEKKVISQKENLSSKNQKIKKFTLWDTVVLLMLIILIIPFILGMLEGITTQFYAGFFIHLLLFAITVKGIIKYFKK
ncbi:MAG: hypothetical protein U9R14_04820, partial [Patescibacteria group bacterium]|nr:hypothetical protein [Patescibacteria group bacterium]